MINSEDLDIVRNSIPCDDNEAWDAIDRITRTVNNESKLDAQEINTILAALRSYQSELSSSPFPDPGSNALATNEFTQQALSIDEIDTLCEKINCS